MFYRSIFAAMAVVLSLTGCGTLQMADNNLDTARKTFAVPTDKAGLYVYRNEHMGGAMMMKVSIDGKEVGRTGAMTYLYQELTPGRHKLTSHAENEDTLELDAKPGTLIYVWQEVKMGLLSARSKLHLAAEEQGRKGVVESRLVQPQ
jgi:uncharacterized lipoprotein NlpE involved in copper resistance